MRFLHVIKSYLDLCRVSNLPTVWTNVLTALVVSSAGFSWQNFLLVSLSMSLFYSGGMCLNDLCDREIDRIKKPLRPIPSNRISIGKAYRFTASLFAGALFLLLFLPFHEALYAGSLLLLVIVVYDLIHKKYSFSVYLVAGCRLLVFVVSGVAVTGALGCSLSTLWF
jgi:4-hydroxybenzoate polyprenyltransferase